MCMILNNQKSDVHVIPCHDVYNVGLIWDREIHVDVVVILIRFALHIYIYYAGYRFLWFAYVSLIKCNQIY
jgi:hypothetical protein